MRMFLWAFCEPTRRLFSRSSKAFGGFPGAQFPGKLPEVATGAWHLGKTAGLSSDQGCSLAQLLADKCPYLRTGTHTSGWSGSEG